jgi:acetyltransferase
MKVVSPTITHKTNVDGVLLNIKGDAEVAAAYEQIVQSVNNLRPGSSIEGISVQPMVLDPKSVEMIVGVKRDPTFGPMLMIGMGGTLTELIQDRVVELPPLNERLAKRMLESLRAWPLLNGFRSRPRVDLEKLVDVLIRLSYLVMERPEVLELDINPLIVSSKSVIAVDARVVLDRVDCKSTHRPYAHLAIRP